MSEAKKPDYVVLVQVKTDEGCAKSIIAVELYGTRSEAAYFARELWQEGLVVPAEKNPTAVKLGLLLDTIVPPAHINNVVVSPYPVSDKAEPPEATLTLDEALGVLDPDDPLSSHNQGLHRLYYPRQQAATGEPNDRG